MKRFLKITYFLVVSTLVGYLSGGCSKSSAPEATPKAACRISSYEAVSTSQFYTENRKTTYDYDGQGNLLKTTATSNKRASTGTVGNQTGTVTVSYTYDADGYLKASTSQELYVTTMAPDKTVSEQITITKSYSYVGGRLSAFTTKRIGAYGVTTTTKASFTYDQAGDLVSKTETSTNEVHDPSIANEIPTGTGSSTRIWTYQKNRLVDYVEQAGGTEQRPLTLQNGVVTKLTIPNYEMRIETDNLQRVTKQEEYAYGRLIRYYTQTWSDAKSTSTILPTFKGFPTIAPTSEFGQEGVLASHKTFVLNEVKGSMEQYDEIVYTIQTNAQGLVTKATITTKHPNLAASSQDVVTTETYTYSDCQ
jgi:YD repeat-containing protein